MTESTTSDKNNEAPAHYHQCQGFPDLCLKDTKGLPREERARVEEQNRTKDLMYRAIRYILVKDFGFSDDLPVTVSGFPGQLSDALIAQYLAVHGLMLADNYTSATMGKDHPSTDDVQVPDPDPARSFFIARRFVDAVVSAVQEYTGRAPLFQKIYKLLKDEGAQVNGAATSRGQSTMAQL
jgi:hypothetical protein